MRSTLIAASLLLRRRTASMLVEGARLDLLPEGPSGPRKFKIKAADSTSRRGLIEGLLRDRYAWRGYQSVALAAGQSVDRFTLAAIDNDAPIGTITVALDVGRPLGADDAFGAELRSLRSTGKRICSSPSWRPTRRRPRSGFWQRCSMSPTSWPTGCAATTCS